MREMTIIAKCDSCDQKRKVTKIPADDEHQRQVDLGGGPHTLDLCKACQHALLDPLAKLIDTHGVPVERTNNTPPPRRALPPSAATYVCPQCKAERSGRGSVISHLVSLHGVELVEASRMVPPIKPSVDCEVCGFLCEAGTGYAAHAVTMHGADVWEKIKAKRAKEQA